MASIEQDVTQALFAVRAGAEGAADRLWTLVYDQLRQIAHRELSRAPGGATLATTDLVHEAYLKCVDASRVDWHDRKHFFAVSCRAMRQVLIDRARRNRTHKREGRMWQVPLEEALVMAEQRGEELLALDDALGRLGRHDARLERVVECHFFGGFTLRETADLLDISHRTVERHWQRARTYLFQMLRPEPGGSHADQPGS
jgi:RNA polymerase sigma factor (TIGR02999 family)